MRVELFFALVVVVYFVFASVIFDWQTYNLLARIKWGENNLTIKMNARFVPLYTFSLK